MRYRYLNRKTNIRRYAQYCNLQGDYARGCPFDGCKHKRSKNHKAGKRNISFFSNFASTTFLSSNPTFVPQVASRRNADDPSTIVYSPVLESAAGCLKVEVEEVEAVLSFFKIRRFPLQCLSITLPKTSCCLSGSSAP